MVLELIRQPFQSFIEAITGGGTGCLDVPGSVAQVVKFHLVCELCCIHSVWEVLQTIHSEKTLEANPVNTTGPQQKLAVYDIHLLISKICYSTMTYLFVGVH